MGDKITAGKLERRGFVRKYEPGEIPDVTFEKNDIAVWNFNNRYWLVDALDQGGIDVEFRTIEHLERFFNAGGREF